MDTEKLKQVLQAFVLSHFSYCPLVWMLYDRSLSHRINHIHERALRFAYKDYQTDFRVSFGAKEFGIYPCKESTFAYDQNL